MDCFETSEIKNTFISEPSKKLEEYSSSFFDSMFYRTIAKELYNEKLLIVEREASHRETRSFSSWNEKLLIEKQEASHQETRSFSSKNEKPLIVEREASHRGTRSFSS